MKEFVNDSLDYGDCGRMLALTSISASAPCRIDMGGTLDIATLHYPLRSFHPLTVNLAVDQRTRVHLSTYTPGHIKVSSRGFDSAGFNADEVPFDHPLGLMFAVAAYFGAHGIHVRIESPSPPKSGLGGSSVAVVALVAAFARLGERQGRKMLTKRQIAMLAHAIESAVSMVPCGIQDQLAAVYGGVNAWAWHANGSGSNFTRRILVKKANHQRFQQQILLAYSGVQHVSSDINGQWLRRFLSGNDRKAWLKIIACTRRFANALAENDIKSAVDAMNEEVDTRRKLTPAVLGKMGEQLVETSIRSGCGARFTGAGGGGCIWALGAAERIRVLKPRWGEVLSTHPEAQLIEYSIDHKGVVVG